MSVAMGMPKPMTVGASRIEEIMDQGRRRHSARRGEDGQQRAARIGKFAHVDFPLQLEADQQEEDGHERIVDPVLDAQRAQGRMPE